MNIMKKILILFAFTLSSYIVYSQVIANAGPDFHSCQYDQNVDNLIIGGSPTAQFGTPPYTYEWSMEDLVLGGGCTYIIIEVNDVLDDIFAPNPRITDRFAADRIPFFLTVTDALGNISKDTCVVTFSNFVHNQTFWTYHINLGDSILLFQNINVTGGVPPLTYQWQPTTGLTDTHIETGFWAKPTQSTSYYVTITDAMGCQAIGSPYYNVIINTVSVEDYEKETPYLIYPNPVSDYIFLKNIGNDKIDNIKIFDMQGKLILYIKAPIQEIDISNYQSGSYVIQIESNQNRFQYKFTKI